jgi:hypothetical protein
MNDLLESYKKDEKTISEFINNNDLPRAVKVALTVNLAEISKFIELLEGMEVEK